jgi:hypothetical protein
MALPQKFFKVNDEILNGKFQKLFIEIVFISEFSLSLINFDRQKVYKSTCLPKFIWF